MTYNELIAYFMDGVRRSLPDGSEVSFLKIPQINRDSVDVLRVVRSGQMISPAICVKDYWNRYYEDEATPETLLREIVDIYDVSSGTHIVPESHLRSYPEAKEHLYPILLNPLRNQELLQTTPHMKLLDLAFVSAVFFTGDSSSMTMSIVGRKLLHNWGISEATLLQDTIANQQRLLSPIIVPIEEMISTLSAQESARQNPDSGSSYPETTMDNGVAYSSVTLQGDINSETTGCSGTDGAEPDGTRAHGAGSYGAGSDGMGAQGKDSYCTGARGAGCSCTGSCSSTGSYCSGSDGTEPEGTGAYCAGSSCSGRPADDAGMKDPGCIPMYVMTNRIHHYGASSILDREQLRLFSDRLGSDLYILPSSIHEVILICKDESRLSYFQRMVQDINSFAVNENEWLGDSIYEWNRETQQISIAR
jgi:hypothetical protein